MRNNHLTCFLRLWTVLLLVTVSTMRLAAQDDLEAHPRDFNALRFSLDKLHRFTGDTLQHGKTFVSLGGGFRQLGMSAADENSSSLSVLDLHIGRQLSPLHTLRLGFGGGVGYYRQPTAEDDGPRRQFTMLHADADYLFSLSSYILGYRPERTLDVSTVLGVGASQTAGGSQALDFHGGLQLKFFAGPHAAITAEPYVMLANKTLSPTSKERSWHKYAVDYGLNLSYVYYFDNVLTAPALAGTFKKLFRPSQRWLRGDSADVAQRRPMFLQYGVGLDGITSLDERSWSQTSGASYSVAFGGWLSSAIGFRAGVGMSNMRWFEDAQRVHYAGYATVSLDAMLNPFGFGRHYNWDAPVGMHLLGGVETGRLSVDASNIRSSTWTLGYRMGVQTWARLDRDTRFFVEPLYRIVNYREGSGPFYRDDALSLKVGVEMLLGKHRPAEAVDSVRWQPRGFFIGGGVGWNTTFRRWRAVDGHDNFPQNGLLTGGYHFNAYHGVALSAEYLTNHFTVKSAEEGFDHWMLSADWLVNVSSLLHGYQPNRRWTVSVLVGPTVALGTDKARVGGNGALQLDYRINKHLALFYQHRLYVMSQSFYPSNQLYSQAGTLVSSMNAGVLYLFDDLVGPVCYVANGFANGVATAATGVAQGACYVANGVATAATGVAKGVATAATGVANGVAQGASFVGRNVCTGVSLLLRGRHSQGDSLWLSDTNRHGFFVAAGGGIHMAFDKWRTDGDGINGNALVAVGYRFNGLHAVRGQFELVSHVDNSSADASHHRLNVFSASYQLGLSQLLTGRDRRWHVGLFAGPSVTTDKHLGAQAGVAVDYDINRYWSLFNQNTFYVLSKSKDILSFSVGVKRRF